MSKKNKIIIISISIAVLFLIGVLLWYILSLNPVNKNNEEQTIIEIQEGMRTEEIVKLLKQNNLIKNEFLTKVYMKLNGIKGLQAGKYQLYQNMSTKEILNKISSGEVYDETVKITFIEGKNINWLANKIAECTNNTVDDVKNLLKDKEYIQSLIQKYWFLTSDIQNESIYYPLEGYLYPDTYIFENADVSVKTIFNIILNNTEKVLSNYKTQIETKNMTVHQVLTIASIIELEGSYNEARLGISSVIYNRLKANMSLGSDVTTYYSIQVDMSERNLYTEEIKASNPYNTRGPGMNGKLPVGPIGNPSKESIEAALNPSQTSYLYFVADSKGKIYFTTTYEEHKQKIDELRTQGLWYEYNT